MKPQPNLFASAEVVSSSKLLSMQLSRGRLWMSRLYFSAYCRAFYVILILMNLACIVWTLLQFGSFPDDLWFLAVEAVLSGLVVLEVGWRLGLQGPVAFCTSLANLFDVAVTVACVVDLGLAAADMVLFLEGLSGEVLLIFRSLIQYLRLVIFIKNQRKARDNLLQMINFSELAEAPKPPSHVLAEEEEKPAPNNTGTAQEGESEDRTQPRQLMIPSRVSV